MNMENNTCRCSSPKYGELINHDGSSFVKCSECGLSPLVYKPFININKKCDKCRDKIPVIYKSECSENGFSAWRPDEYYQCAYCPDCGHKNEAKYGE